MLKRGLSTEIVPPYRLAFLCALFLGCAAVLVWRLGQYQISDTAHYQRLADDERRAEIPIPPKRGGIYDANGYPLAISVPYDSVWAHPPLMGDLAKAAQTLSPIIGLPADQIRAKLAAAKNQPVVLSSRVSANVAQQIRDLNYPGVLLQQEPIREYPNGSLAAQVVGFVGQDNKGLGGIELSYDKELAGKAGVIDTEKDINNQEITLGRRLLTPPQEGVDLITTLDRHMQRVSEQLLAQAVQKQKARGGLILIMEPKTGSIVAAATIPTYSLTANPIYDPARASAYKTTIVTDQYEPGSTMKTVTMSAAIEEGLVTPNTTYNDTGLARVGGVLIHNWNGEGNGVINMTQALITSSNVTLQWVGGLLGPDRLYHYFDAFGFGKPTGIRLPGEVGGTVRTNKDEGWTRVDLATNSYGQGVAVTPLQMLNAVAAIANNGLLMRPRIVKEIRDAQGVHPVDPEPIRQAVSPQTAHTLISMMTDVGNQEPGFPVPGYVVGLKTGTADTPTNLGYDLSLTFASVVSVLPANDPRYVALIRIDGPESLYGGQAAAPVLRELAQELFDYYRIPPDNLASRGSGRS